MQYNEWKKELLALNYLPVCDYQEAKGTSVSDPTTKTAYRALYYEEKIAMIKEAAEKCDYVLQDYIFEAVTTGRTFAYFEANRIPCCRDTFYDRLRKFYFYLDKLRM